MFLWVFLSSADFFKIDFFLKKNLSGTLSECQTVWIQIRTDIVSGLIWVQTVCKGYQQTAIVTARKERLKFKHLLSHRKKLKTTDPCHIFAVSDHVILNPARSATETSQILKFSR